MELPTEALLALLGVVVISLVPMQRLTFDLGVEQILAASLLIREPTDSLLGLELLSIPAAVDVPSEVLRWRVSSVPSVLFDWASCDMRSCNSAMPLLVDLLIGCLSLPVCPSVALADLNGFLRRGVISIRPLFVVLTGLLIRLISFIPSLLFDLATCLRPECSLPLLDNPPKGDNLLAVPEEEERTERPDLEGVLGASNLP